MGEMFLKRLRPEYVVDSVGTWVHRDDDENHHGRKLGSYGEKFKNVLEAMCEEGIDISENERIQLSEEMLGRFDDVIVLAEPYSFPEYFSKYPNLEFWTVDDPKDQELDFHRRVRDEIKKKVEERFK